MADFYGIIRAEDVVDDKTFAQYVQQRLGTPYPTGKGLGILRKHIKLVFNAYPDANYQTLVKLVEWAKSKNKKFANTYNLVASYRYAWRDGYLPELDPNPTKEIDQLITAALQTETDPDWTRRLMLSSGLDAKMTVYEAWRKKDSSGATA